MLPSTKRIHCNSQPVTKKNQRKYPLDLKFLHVNPGLPSQPRVPRSSGSDVKSTRLCAASEHPQHKVEPLYLCIGYAVYANICLKPTNIDTNWLVKSRTVTMYIWERKYASLITVSWLAKRRT